MSELEILTIAAPAAQALLACMVSDGWQTAKGRFARLLGRGNQAEMQTIERDLEEARQNVMEGSVDSSTITREIWKARFRQTLIANPDMAGDLQELLDEISDKHAKIEEMTHQSAVANDNAVIFQQGSGSQNYYGSANNDD